MLRFLVSMRFNLFIICFLLMGHLYAQVKSPFQKEVDEIVEKYQNESWQKNGIVFTGSSSIRMWRNLDKYFPKNQIINTGFGGSQTYDLVIHLNELVLDFEPAKVFIYEGDNDVNAGVSTPEIIHRFKELTEKVFDRLPESNIYLIGTKPSPSRWDLKEHYLEFNHALESFANSDKRLTYIDVWQPMLEMDGNPKADLFLQDNLHMNEKGYAIWKTLFQPHLR